MNMRIEKILEIAVQAGAMVLENGGETYRAEETCIRIAKAMGAKEASAFVTPTVVMVSVGGQEQGRHTTMHRITNRTVNLQKISLLNDLSRRLVRRGHHSNPLQVARLLERIRTAPSHSLWSMMLMGGLSSFFFALMFGCTPAQAICSLVLGLLLRFILYWIGKIHLNTFILSLVSGGFVSILYKLALILEIVPESVAVMTAALMQVMPGLALVNSIRDLISGDLMAGTARLMDAFMVATGLSVGSVLGLMVFAHVMA